ncbi:MAG: RNA polymerase factor sigma-54 [Planctomycetota bacterium]|nr:RNA polymerase factor sigma-54 [Planctomycetota bacterium]MDI6786750.1 RNA polymerase factor sigma-54 [Planctomycetota bacterium]
MTPENRPIGFRAELQPKLQQKQTFQQIQYMDILLLNSLELTNRIYEELEQNPALEMSNEIVPTPSSEENTTRQEVSADDKDTSGTVVDTLDDDRDYTFRGSFQPSERDAKLEMMQNTPDRPENLQDYVYFQFLMMDLPDSTRIFGRDIIYNIEDDGFLKTPLEKIAELHKVDIETVEKVLRIIRRLDPPGIGARDISECLLAQISEDDNNFSLKKLIITQYLDQLKPYKLLRLSKLLNEPLDKVKEVVEEIKALNFHPSAGFSSKEIPFTIIPDVIVTKEGDSYEIKIQHEYFPSIVLSQYYQNMLASKSASGGDKNTKLFIRDKVKSARRFLQAIRLRDSSLRMVAEQILLQQRDFFDKGVEHLKPLFLKDVAKNLDFHLSTISRTTANKHIQTPHGLFSMKFFFSSTAETAEGNFYAQPSVLLALKEIVGKEDKTCPLNDPEIVKILQQKGFKISRRTVAKYRQILGIPNTAYRRVKSVPHGQD